MLKILVVFGTRPEAIKMAPVILALKQQQGIETIVCVTAQHREMLDSALDVFDLRADYDLDIMRPGQTLESMTSSVLSGLSNLIRAIRPDRVLIHGDTTTAFGAAVASFYCGVPVGHVEAGLRTGNLQAPWPEEFNRRAVDLIADLLWAPTDAAAAALSREGCISENIVVTGNTVIDALKLVRTRIESDAALHHSIWQELPNFSASKHLILVTGHRRESFGGGLSNICQALNRLAIRKDVVIVWPVHPNPNVLQSVQSNLEQHPNIYLIEPQNYLTFVALMIRSRVIITDSGGIQEEAPAIGRPVLVTRDETERPEAISAGTARLVGTNIEHIINATNELLDEQAAYDLMSKAHNPFGDGSAASRIVKSIMLRHGVQT